MTHQNLNARNCFLCSCRFLAKPSHTGFTNYLTNMSQELQDPYVISTRWPQASMNKRELLLIKQQLRQNPVHHLHLNRHHFSPLVAPVRIPGYSYPSPRCQFGCVLNWQPSFLHKSVMLLTCPVWRYRRLFSPHLLYLFLTQAFTTPLLRLFLCR